MASKARRPARGAGKPAAKRSPKAPPAPAAKKAARKAPRGAAARRPGKAPGPAIARTTPPTAPARPATAEKLVTLRVNGRPHGFALGRDLTPSMTLSYVLREKLGLTGLKVSCDEGACGACTVLLDGKAVLSCMMLAVEAEGHEILTIEGLPKDDAVVAAFAEQCEPGCGTALQCGYCTPGFVMATHALLRENAAPTLAETKEALSGNLCRCGCYPGIAQAVRHASEKLAARGGGK